MIRDSYRLCGKRSERADDTPSWLLEFVGTRVILNLETGRSTDEQPAPLEGTLFPTFEGDRSEKKGKKEKRTRSELTRHRVVENCARNTARRCEFLDEEPKGPIFLRFIELTRPGCAKAFYRSCNGCRLGSRVGTHCG